MDVESAVSPIADLFREILYDVLGLFAPGAALLIVAYSSKLESIEHAIRPLMDSLPLFIGCSYVLGYAIQGVTGHIWTWLVVRILNRKSSKNVTPESSSEGMKGVSPAGRQTYSEVVQSELFRSLRTQIGELLQVKEPEKLTVNEVQNLSYSVAGLRAANAFTFSYRADLCAGMSFVFLVAVLLTVVSRYSAAHPPSSWRIGFYLLLTAAFFLRAKFYYNIRGRIIYSIGLAVVAEERTKAQSAAAKS